MNKAFKGLNLKRGKKQNKERGKIVRKKNDDVMAQQDFWKIAMVTLLYIV